MVADIGTKPLTAARFEFLKVCMGMGKLESKSEVGVEEGKARKEGEKKEEKKEQDGQLANKEKKRLAETAQVLRLITLAASIAVTKAEEEKEAGEAFSFEVILIYFDLHLGHHHFNPTPLSTFLEGGSKNESNKKNGGTHPSKNVTYIFATLTYFF